MKAPEMQAPAFICGRAAQSFSTPPCGFYGFLMGCMGFLAPLPQRHTLRREAQAALIAGPHGPDKGLHVPAAHGLEAGVHGQLGHADVHRGDGQLGVGDVPQRGPAHLIGTVGVVLHRHLCPAAELRKHGAGHAVRGVAGGVLHHHAAVEHRGLVGVRQLRVVGMAGCGTNCRIYRGECL